jgi:uncharacterized membrane protein YeaQ/YmgE (transglycosylase-associated protein family)
LIVNLQFPENTQLLINDLLVWIGYGTVVGLLAKAVMPGKDPGGPIATLAMGITGVVIGCGVWSMVNDGQRITPISPVGLVCGTTGAFVILLFYRMLGGYWYEERRGRGGVRRRSSRGGYRRRRLPTVDVYDD